MDEAYENLELSEETSFSTTGALESILGDQDETLDLSNIDEPENANSAAFVEQISSDAPNSVVDENSNVPSSEQSPSSDNQIAFEESEDNTDAFAAPIEAFLGSDENTLPNLMVESEKSHDEMAQEAIADHIEVSPTPFETNATSNLELSVNLNADSASSSVNDDNSNDEPLMCSDMQNTFHEYQENLDHDGKLQKNRAENLPTPLDAPVLSISDSLTDVICNRASERMIVDVVSIGEALSPVLPVDQTPSNAPKEIIYGDINSSDEDMWGIRSDETNSTDSIISDSDFYEPDFYEPDKTLEVDGPPISHGTHSSSILEIPSNVTSEQLSKMDAAASNAEPPTVDAQISYDVPLTDCSVDDTNPRVLLLSEIVRRKTQYAMNNLTAKLKVGRHDVNTTNDAELKKEISDVISIMQEPTHVDNILHNTNNDSVITDKSKADEKMPSLGKSESAQAEHTISMVNIIPRTSIPTKKRSHHIVRDLFDPELDFLMNKSADSSFETSPNRASINGKIFLSEKS